MNGKVVIVYIQWPRKGNSTQFNIFYDAYFNILKNKMKPGKKAYDTGTGVDLVKVKSGPLEREEGLVEREKELGHGKNAS